MSITYNFFIIVFHLKHNTFMNTNVNKLNPSYLEHFVKKIGMPIK